MSHYVNTDVLIDILIQSAGVRMDPTNVSLQIVTPGGSTVLYTYGVNAELERTGVGQYQLKLNLSVVGTYTYLWTVSGNVSGTEAGSIVVVNPPRIVTINAQTTLGAAAVPDARIEVKKGSTVIGSGTTDTLGAFSVPLSAGVYTLVAYKSGWTFTAAQITVLGTQPPGSESFTILGSSLDIGSATVAVCRLFGFTFGKPGIRVMVRTLKGPVPGGPAETYNNIHVSTSSKSIVPNEGGYWETDVLVGSTILVEIPVAKLKKTFIVPNKLMLNIADAVSAVTEKSP